MKKLRNQTYRICLRWLSSTLYIWIFKYSFALVKLPLFSRNEPQNPPLPSKKKRNSWAVLNRTIPFAQAVYRAFLDWENQSNHRGKSKGRKIPLRTNEISKLKQSNCLKREKTRVTKSWLVLVLHLISWESDSSFRDQWQSKKKKRQKQTNPALLSTLNWKLLSWSVLSVTLENKL